MSKKKPERVVEYSPGFFLLYFNYYKQNNFIFFDPMLETFFIRLHTKVHTIFEKPVKLGTK